MLLELPGGCLSDGSVDDTVGFQFPKHAENAINLLGGDAKSCMNALFASVTEVPF